MQRNALTVAEIASLTRDLRGPISLPGVSVTPEETVIELTLSDIIECGSFDSLFAIPKGL